MKVYIQLKDEETGRKSKKVLLEEIVYNQGVDMSKADEMFFEAGFDEKEERLSKIIYYVDLPFWKPSITFNKKHKSVKSDLCITMQELQAINEKVKELGWNE